MGAPRGADARYSCPRLTSRALRWTSWRTSRRCR
jgi:hypothetical protein